MLADALTPLAISLSALLVLSGVAKLRAPADAADLLATAGVRGGRGLVVLIGSAEIALGVVGLAEPSPASVLCLVAAYLGFAAFSGYALRVGAAGASCGCFGATAAPLTRMHVVASIAAAIGALACVAGGSPHGLAWLAQHDAAVAIVGLAASAAATAGWAAVFTLLSDAWSAWSPEGLR